MKKIISNFIADIIIAVVFLAIGVVMFPLLPMGRVILSAMVAAFLIGYTVLYLFKKVARSKGICFVASIIEVIFVISLAVGVLLKQFNLLGSVSICSLLGIVIWARGCSSLIGDKFSRSSKSPKLPFLFAIFLTTFGAVITVSPFISNTVILWAISIFSIVVALVFGFLAILVAPYGNKNK